MSHGLLLWLENIDRRRNQVVPIAPGLDCETLRAHHRTLTVCLMSVCVCVFAPLGFFIHDPLTEFVLSSLMSRQQIQQELLESQQKVSSLQELSAQLLVALKPDAQLPQTQRSEHRRAQGSECLEAQEKVHVIMNRLKLLLREVTSDLQGLEERLEALDRRQVRKQETQSLPACLHFLLELNSPFVCCRSV